jgi:8-oxo-dGTP diphosphatase
LDARQVFGSPGAAHRSRLTASFCPQCGAVCEERVVGGLPRSACTACSYVHFVNPTPGVAVLVLREEHVLLVRRGGGDWSGGKWCMPCGVLEYEEDFLTAGIREVKEESGIDVTIDGLISVVSNFFETGASTFSAVLLASAVGGNLRPDDYETTDACWFHFEALPPLAFEADAHIIGRYFAMREAGARVDPVFRTLNGSTPEVPRAERQAP